MAGGNRQKRMMTEYLVVRALCDIACGREVSASTLRSAQVSFCFSAEEKRKSPTLGDFPSLFPSHTSCFAAKRIFLFYIPWISTMTTIYRNGNVVTFVYLRKSLNLCGLTRIWKGSMNTWKEIKIPVLEKQHAEFSSMIFSMTLKFELCLKLYYFKCIF